MDMINMTKKSMSAIERKFVKACIDEGITDSSAMILIATRTLRHINKDMVAGYKAGESRKRNIRKRLRRR